MVQFIQTNFVLILTLLFALGALFGAIVNNKRKDIFININTAITAAEALEKSNPEKFQYVLDNTYGALPWFFKLFISKLQVSMAIQYVFAKVKAYAKQQIDVNLISTQDKEFEALKNNPVLTGVDQATLMKAIDGTPPTYISQE